eukprot:2549314-Rhodomonas_salina.2
MIILGLAHWARDTSRTILQVSRATRGPRQPSQRPGPRQPSHTPRQPSHLLSDLQPTQRPPPLQVQVAPLQPAGPRRPARARPALPVAFVTRARACQWVSS